MNIQEAGDAARWRHTGSSQPDSGPAQRAGTVYVETGFSAASLVELRRGRHNNVAGSGGFGGYQAIMKDKAQGIYWVASEMRRTA